MKSKKAIAFETLALIILVVAIAIPLSAFVIKYGIFAKEKSDFEVCRASIMQGLGPKGPLSPMKYLPLKCKRRELWLRYKDIVKGGKIDQDRASKLIADEIARCWYMVGEGKVDPFARWTETGKTYCLVCSAIKVDAALSKFHNDSVGRLEASLAAIRPIEWMKQNKYKGEMSYLEYVRLAEIYEHAKDKYIIPDSQIIVAMYKQKIGLTTLEWLTVALGAITLGLVVIAGLILAGVAVPGIILIAATGIAKGALAVAGGVLLYEVAVGAVFVQPMVALASFGSNFDQCYAERAGPTGAVEKVDCKGYGGITIVSPLIRLTQEIPFKDSEGKEHKAQICNVLVN